MKSNYYILLAFLLIIFIIWWGSEPEIITYGPIQQNTKVNVPITIKFDKKIDPKSVIKNLKITPEVDLKWSYNSTDSIIVIEAKEGWQHLTTYKVVLNDGVKTRFGRAINKRLEWSFSTPAPESINITLLGDLVLYHLTDKLAEGNANYAFTELNSNILDPNNFILTNLENPISNKGTEIKNKAYRFRSTPETVKIIEAGNIDAVTLANNHALDYGPEALVDTVKNCNDSDIITVGYGKNGSESVNPVITQHNGYKIGLVSYLDKVIVPYQHRKLWQGGNGQAGVKFIDDSIFKDIDYLKKNTDIVIVALHWGIEREKYITPKQIELAHQLIDSGADIIMGHHPHVVQGIEKYKEGIIFYSLGNFVFPPTNENRRSTYTVVLNLSKDKVNETILYPIKPVNGVPYSMNEEQVKSFSKELLKLSSQFSTKFVVNKQTIVVK